MGKGCHCVVTHKEEDDGGASSSVDKAQPLYSLFGIVLNPVGGGEQKHLKDDIRFASAGNWKGSIVRVELRLCNGPGISAC